MNEFWNIYNENRSKYRLSIIVKDMKKGWSVHIFRRNVKSIFLGGKAREFEDSGDQEILFCAGESNEEVFDKAIIKLKEWINNNSKEELIEGFNN